MAHCVAWVDCTLNSCILANALVPVRLQSSMCATMKAAAIIVWLAAAQATVQHSVTEDVELL
jgi:hypothetical protein